MRFYVMLYLIIWILVEFLLLLLNAIPLMWISLWYKYKDVIKNIIWMP